MRVWGSPKTATRTGCANWTSTKSSTRLQDKRTLRNTRAWSGTTRSRRTIDFNLNIPRYIDAQTPEDIQDIEGHLRGGIPVSDLDALQQYWDVCPKLRKALFKPNRKGYVDLAVAKDAIKTTIYGHAEFAGFIDGMNAHFAAWQTLAAKTLKALKPGCTPKAVIADLSEDLLAHYGAMPLIDKYDVYQHLMDYWAASMQDDCYLIAADGWKAETARVVETDKKGKEKDKGWACDLIPKPLIVARYFAADQKALEALEAEFESVAAEISELEEEHGGEDGAYSELDKVNKANVAARLKEIRGDKDSIDEVKALEAWQALNAKATDLKRSKRRMPRSMSRPMRNIRSSKRPRSRRL